MAVGLYKSFLRYLSSIRISLVFLVLEELSLLDQLALSFTTGFTWSSLFLKTYICFNILHFRCKLFALKLCALCYAFFTVTFLPSCYEFVAFIFGSDRLDTQLNFIRHNFCFFMLDLFLFFVYLRIGPSDLFISLL